MPFDPLVAFSSLHDHNSMVCHMSTLDMSAVPIACKTRMLRFDAFTSFLDGQPGTHGDSSSTGAVHISTSGSRGSASSFDDGERSGYACNPALKIEDQQVCPIGPKGAYVCDPDARGFYHGGPHKFTRANAATGGCHTYIFMSKRPRMSDGTPCIEGTFCDGCLNYPRHAAHPVNTCEAHVWARDSGAPETEDQDSLEVECQFMPGKCKPTAPLKNGARGSVKLQGQNYLTQEKGDDEEGEENATIKDEDLEQMQANAEAHVDSIMGKEPEEG
eukprot:gnl/MRDRNA2_/MRDRNA2_127547_c0_seq1.p1 gnl/MRDRNA2_/MRDRNA2_127547_c0~~gnl/MRDRNA2_/MRDRNA2_127547_c0_seq1.p1  ORF type:complete len:273 (-),score=50.19 gnl/MRDRNA2_/MRDRNA2_127547_c0_seq1:25-843(-)